MSPAADAVLGCTPTSCTASPATTAIPIVTNNHARELRPLRQSRASCGSRPCRCTQPPDPVASVEQLEQLGPDGQPNPLQGNERQESKATAPSGGA